MTDDIRAQEEQAWAEYDAARRTSGITDLEWAMHGRRCARAELNAGPRGGKLHDRQPRVVVDDERKAA
jgi:hypothetical protein